ncbi:flavin reductase family protein [Glaciimonas immobilis]|uniref:Flavin reductase (DIM6/NTAB) family NADH-FMN oxidoreductase RutF n=1 Tax=Glaciimonas immobilis TaxID=728004 RepID=A0A840RVF1_9BURK|nr:flavin reductase family protein [Glaciimonas immobilis]KAF3996490.1 flavin reductase family protein [Glaciimonas immobilis]MBB5201152.1 flavin reductase (DIM6/NTAB) family NADH-FMN oxidoreductase RutF [Glaciimonas immobilis]
MLMPNMTTVKLDGQHDGRQLRNALGRFPTGVTVITTRAPDGKLEGLTANSFSALSLDPPLVLWSVKRNASSLPGFLASGHFAINVLGVAQSDLSQRFATPSENKFSGLVFEDGLGGSPVLEGVLASFECQTESTLDGGDHVLFVGRVHKLSYHDGEPLMFNAGRYCRAQPLPMSAEMQAASAMWADLG